jgi:hypothetical protein
MSDWREAFYDEGRAYIARFVDDGADYVPHPVKIKQGWSHYVERGTYEGRDVVLKFFNMDERWQNELFCTRHFAATGLVPEIRATYGNRLIAMDYIPGTMPRQDGIDDSVLSNLEKRAILSRDLGQATGRISMVPLPTDSEGRFPPAGFVPFEPTGWFDDVVTGIDFYMDLARRIERQVPAYEVDLFAETLNLLEYARDRVADERRIMFLYDFGNLHVFNGRLQGIFDLESARLGTPSMQLSKGLACNTDYGLDREAFLSGYGEITGNHLDDGEHEILLAMQQLERLVRVCKDGKWDGSDADKELAKQIAQSSLEDLRRSVDAYSPWIDLARWFPSLAKN